MNIFQTLSQGKSRLHEPSISAMLGYLLDSNQDHGLGDTFTRKFLECLGNDSFVPELARDFINAQVSLEEPYQLNGERKNIDIQMIILNDNKEEAHRLIIENKIKVGAANPKQLKDYYHAVLEEDPQISNLHIIFLTPSSNSPLLNEEYNRLSLNENPSHFKQRFYWSNNNSTEGVLPILVEILSLELKGAINPINEYMRHTLKAFIKHCSFLSEPKKTKSLRRGEDIGKITDEIEITTKSGSNKVIRRDSSQVQVYNSETGDKEVARPVLIEYIRENHADIATTTPPQQTRIIGSKFFKWYYDHQG